MPNGYTSDIYEGKDMSLRNYLMRVGRGMSMAIMQRDSPPDEPVALRKVSTFAQERLAEAVTEQVRLKSMSSSEIHRAAREEFDTQLAEHEKALTEDAELSARYDDMIAKVQAWQPEPEVAYVKDHALRYLRESKDFDCGSIYPSRPQRKSGAQWLDEKLKKNERDIDYYTKQWDEEVERVADFNKVILAFHRSLPDA